MPDDVSDSNNTQQVETDRYISFRGLDCDDNARQVMQCIDHHLAIPGHSNVFWEYFNNKRAGNSVSRPDDLFLIHSHINQVRELFETWDDETSLALLEKLEEECC